MKLTPKNWGAFQHYKTRRPPWIKLYRSLLDDPDFMRLPVASKALAPCLWLLASEYDNGTIDQAYDGVAYRLRLTDNELAQGLKPLIDKGFFNVEGDDASVMLASCLQDACLEREERESRETPLNPPSRGATKKKSAERKATGTRLPDDWCHEIQHEHLAKEMGVVLYDELMKFRDYFLSEGKVKADWSRTFNSWLRNAGERRNRATTWSRK
jgi:hypothetical protein